MKVSLQDLQSIFKNHEFCDLIPQIYKQYLKLFYDNYTLWELMDILDSHDIPIDCQLSKRAIIQFIEDKKINIIHNPDKVKRPTLWTVYNMKYIDYVNYAQTKLVSKNVICVSDVSTRTEIMDMDVYILYGVRYIIHNICNDNMIELQNIDAGDTIEPNKTIMPISEFMKIMDEDYSIVEKNQIRNNRIKYDWRVS